MFIYFRSIKTAMSVWWRLFSQRNQQLTRDVLNSRKLASHFMLRALNKFRVHYLTQKQFTSTLNMSLTLWYRTYLLKTLLYWRSSTALGVGIVTFEFQDKVKSVRQSVHMWRTYTVSKCVTQRAMYGLIRHAKVMCRECLGIVS